ncbi:MAG: Flp pilus assembly complex ATPase component TadA [Treponema sp.]|nr:Flp pilus assembly complex ATPase component TadA [Treponema sp.]
MRDFEFKLTPAYCLYNGVAVMEQKGAEIRFITESEDDTVLRKRLEKAFLNHVSYVLKQKDCTEDFKVLPKVLFETGSHEEVRKYISRLYHEEDGKTEEKSETRKEVNEAAAVILLDSILDEARNNSVTDIHIENCFIRFRKNGKLENYASIQQERNNELVLRIKLLAGMNVLEKRKSQDGHFVYGEKNPVFVRVSTVGVESFSSEDSMESVVLRLLDTSRLPLDILRLGFSDRQLVALDTLMELPNGLILICGPTGSGKSTTAASILVNRYRKSSGKEKIISLEDPPEYLIPGVTQIKTGKGSGISFTEALENVFRQDPDVIMIGEIRDKCSAETALRASMTGHLVFATLHTDSAASAFLRLKDLGGNPEIIASVLKGVIIQELQHEEKDVTLLADICIPEAELKAEGVSEDSFVHITNVPELIVKTGKNLTARKVLKLIDERKTLRGAS